MEGCWTDRSTKAKNDGMYLFEFTLQCIVLNDCFMLLENPRISKVSAVKLNVVENVEKCGT